MSEILKYLESHQKQFDATITEAYTSEADESQQRALMQSVKILKEVEMLIERKRQAQKFLNEKNLGAGFSDSQQAKGDSQDISFLSDSSLHKIEKLSEQTNNMVVQYNIMRIFDLVLKGKLINIEQKDTSDLIYFINNIFLLHDLMVGTSIARRMVQRSKALLNYVLKRKDINEDQEEEIKELLALPNLKGSDAFNDFENQTFEIKRLCKSTNIPDKISGIQQLSEKLTQCLTLQEQLSLFSSKCQAIIKSMIRDIKEGDKEIFNTLSNFLTAMIFDTEYLVEIDKDILSQTLNGRDYINADVQGGQIDTSKETILYQLTEQKEALEQSEGLYSSIALIINFFLSFPKNINLQSTVLTVFKRLYNSFHVYRKNLEDPIIMVLINIHHKFNELQQNKSYLNRAKAAASSGQQEQEDQKIEESYIEAQKFVNYLISSDETEATFKEKIFSRKELQSYLAAESLEKHKPNPKCLSIQKYGEFNIKVGYPQLQEIGAGANFFQMIEVEEPNSIIFCGFSTTSHDIQFGFHKVTLKSQVSNEEEIQHEELEGIFPLTKIESFPNFVKVSFIAKDAGIYKVLWSNDHSWFKGKTLAYRISVLRPVQRNEGNKGYDVQSSLLNSEVDPYKSTSAPSSQRSTTNGSSANSASQTSANSNMIRQQLRQSRAILPTIDHKNVIFKFSKVGDKQELLKRKTISIFMHIDLDYDQVKISFDDSKTELTNELNVSHNLSQLIDENLEQLFKQQNMSIERDQQVIKISIGISKTQKALDLVKGFNHQEVTQIQDIYYTITIVHDSDVLALNQFNASNMQSSESSKASQSHISIRISDIYFYSSMILRNRLVQSKNSYSYEVGDVGALEIMAETFNTDNSGHSGDEVSGGPNTSPDHRKGSISSKQYGLKKLRDSWRESQFMAIALANFQRLSSQRLNVVFVLSGFEDESQKVKLNDYVKQVKDHYDSISQGISDLGINIELKEDDYQMQAIKNIVPLFDN
ncbi:fyve and coiled-coil domain-containing protein 1-like [Stylonychia lemnae]|uniref:Fyve and coiled-coil domain-containing protein 1-like n=1 Tax=Stylonychia lemnae TaxID=5949 RepID=A0A078AUL8_STYLE|nr:fyve and coiled-coil domain-containing protein 1-like [Stylonychia lemnae]|eukprot:CDW84927.1 fyve and coiled-coil domain-containing protein 1-like [Stylonychia lemnae]